ncbi:MAG TPA: FecR domain-containing protein [Anaerolineales bacterium]|nr:FecR domain-containing protein [Anaerolineales bacterium]
MQLDFRLSFRPQLFLILILILSACAPEEPNYEGPTLTPRSSATPVEPTGTATAGAQVQPVSTEPLFQASLAVVGATATVIGSGGSQTEVQQAQTINVQEGDRVRLFQRDAQTEQSHSILTFPDFLQVELLGGTVVVVEDVEATTQFSTDARLRLNAGHLFAFLNERAIAQLTVETPHATIRTLMDGTQFSVCQSEERTCILVRRGAVEVSAKDQKEIVKAGSAGFVLDNQPPSPPVCAPAASFVAWEQNFRRSAKAPALDREISRLPQQPCPVTSAGLPVDARILYLDHFTDPSGGWEQEGADGLTAGYAERTYYKVQIQARETRYLAFIPDQPEFDDANIDTRVFAGTNGEGDFRFGLVLRRTADRYYAFVVSPPTRTWYFLKNTPDGLEILKDKIGEEALDLEVEDALRVEAQGPNFLLFINGRFVDWVRDFDYTRGEAGLFVETRSNKEALVHFDVLTVWELPEPVLTGPGASENCFNNIDDDGDGLVDTVDPNCQRLDRTRTPVPTSTLRPTATFRPTFTARPTLPPTITPTRPTNTPKPTRTPRTPTATQPLPPTQTPVTPATNTNPPPATVTDPPPATATEEPEPTATEPPEEPSPTQPPIIVDPTETEQPAEPTPTEPPVETPPTGLLITLILAGLVGATKLRIRK